MVANYGAGERSLGLSPYGWTDVDPDRDAGPSMVAYAMRARRGGGLHFDHVLRVGAVQ